jgi:acylphosphatase
MTAHIIVSGFVQGVGFRRFVKHHARKLGLTGWVKNLQDNRVEAILQGSKEQIDKMIKICKKGCFLSEVQDVQVDFADLKEHFQEFKIVR